MAATILKGGWDDARGDFDLVFVQGKGMTYLMKLLKANPYCVSHRQAEAGKRGTPYGSTSSRLRRKGK